MRLDKLTASLFLLALFLQVDAARASSLIVPATKSNNAAAANIKYLKSSEFVKLSAKDFAQITGKKLNVFQRMSFQIVKLKMKHDLKKNHDLLVTDYTKSPSQSGSRFSFLWFILGIAGVILGLMMPVWPLFFISAFAPIAVAYITKQDSVSKKSVWIGFGVGLLLLLLLILIILATITSYRY